MLINVILSAAIVGLVYVGLGLWNERKRQEREVVVNLEEFWEKVAALKEELNKARGGEREIHSGGEKGGGTLGAQDLRQERTRGKAGAGKEGRSASQSGGPFTYG